MFSVIFLYAEREVRMCSTVSGDLQWSQFGDCSLLSRQE